MSEDPRNSGISGDDQSGTFSCWRVWTLLEGGSSWSCWILGCVTWTFRRRVAAMLEQGRDWGQAKRFYINADYQAFFFQCTVLRCVFGWFFGSKKGTVVGFRWRLPVIPPQKINEPFPSRHGQTKCEIERWRCPCRWGGTTAIPRSGWVVIGVVILGDGKMKND